MKFLIRGILQTSIQCAIVIFLFYHDIMLRYQIMYGIELKPCGKSIPDNLTTLPALEVIQ